MTRHPNGRRSGFTLLELIVVITIIGILATIVTVKTAGFGTKGRMLKVERDLQTILDASNMIQTQTGFYPESIEELVNPKDENGNDLVGGLEKFPKDPWGNEYDYELVGGKPLVRCLGADGVEGGEGENEDKQKPEEEAY